MTEDSTPEDHSQSKQDSSSLQSDESDVQQDNGEQPSSSIDFPETGTIVNDTQTEGEQDSQNSPDTGGPTLESLTGSNNQSDGQPASKSQTSSSEDKAVSGDSTSDSSPDSNITKEKTEELDIPNSSLLESSDEKGTAGNSSIDKTERERNRNSPQPPAENNQEDKPTLDSLKGDDDSKQEKGENSIPTTDDKEEGEHNKLDIALEIEGTDTDQKDLPVVIPENPDSSSDGVAAQGPNKDSNNASAAPETEDTFRIQPSQESGKEHQGEEASTEAITDATLTQDNSTGDSLQAPDQDHSQHATSEKQSLSGDQTTSDRPEQPQKKATNKSQTGQNERSQSQAKEVSQTSPRSTEHTGQQENSHNTEGKKARQGRSYTNMSVTYLLTVKIDRLLLKDTATHSPPTATSRILSALSLPFVFILTILSDGIQTIASRFAHAWMLVGLATLILTWIGPPIFPSLSYSERLFFTFLTISTFFTLPIISTWDGEDS
jgi:hypothetical protein